MSDWIIAIIALSAVAAVSIMTSVVLLVCWRKKSRMAWKRVNNTDVEMAKTEDSADEQGAQSASEESTAQGVMTAEAVSIRPAGPPAVVDVAKGGP